KTGSYEYMARLKGRIETEMPELSAYFSSGGMVDAVLNLGLPAPIDVQVTGTNMENAHATALRLAARIRKIEGVADVYIPQDIDYIVAEPKVPAGLTVSLRRMVQGMRASFRSFALGLCLALVLLYLILVAQFRSFVDPLLILIAVPPGIAGVILMLWGTDTT